MELKQLTTFRTVAAELSFTKAAERLNYAQSSVTAQIQTLEEELGVPLFERLGKRVNLTDAGKRLLQYSEKLLQLAEEAQTSITADSEPSGMLTIGAPESLCTYRLPPLLRRYRAMYPQVQLVFRAGICSELRRELSQGALDIAFTMEAPVRAQHLHVEPLVREKMLLLAEPNHPLRDLLAVFPADLGSEPVVVTEAGCSYRDMFEHALHNAGVNPASKLELFSIEAIKQCVIAGMGVSILPEMSVAKEVAEGQLTALNWAGEEFEVITQVAWHKDKWLSPALRAFIDLTRQMLQDDAARVRMSECIQ